jgi:predicted nucleotidyltransferase
MFTVSERDHLRDHVLRLATADPRVVAGAVVGSLARTEGDRWSDLDLTFAVEDPVPITEVLEDWTRDLIAEFRAVHLFDLPSGASLYRVFLLPGCLQFDLSFTPASSFGARGPKFRMIFGSSVEQPFAPSPSPHELLGHAVHHALRARFSIERGRYWHAEYWISSLRDCALALACRRRDLPAVYGRGFDDLPAGVRAAFERALVSKLEREELMSALGCAIDGLLREVDEVRDLAARVEPQLRELMAALDS